MENNRELFECHGHLMMDGTSYASGRARHEEAVDRAAVEEALAALRAAGVVYFRDGGDPLNVSLLGRALAPDYGIEYVTPGFAIHKNGLYGGIVGRAYTDLADYRQRLRELRQAGGDFVKIMASGIITFKAYGQLSCVSLPAAEIRELIHIAHGEGFAVMTHVNGPETIRAVAEAGGDSVEHGYFMDDAALEAMREHGTVWVPTLAAVEAFTDREGIDPGIAGETLRRQREMLRKAADMGVLIAAGSDSGAVGVPHGAGTRREYALLAKSGITPEQIQAGNEAIRRRMAVR